MKRFTEKELLHIYALFIDEHKINIAESYDEWLNVAFACASCGKDARGDFDLIARQSSKYNDKEQRLKWNNAIKTGHADGIGFIVNSVKNYGAETKDVVRWFGGAAAAITPAAPKVETSKKAKPTNNKFEVPDLPSLASACVPENDTSEAKQQKIASPSKMAQLTKAVREAIEKIKELTPLLTIATTDEQLVAACWGLLAGLSAVARRTFVRYDGRLQHVHIYYLLCAPAASGKGVLSDVRQVFADIQTRERMRARENWENYKQLFNQTPKDQREIIPKPKAPTFWLPADTSTSALISAIRDNEGGGCIWESEIDTINRAIKSDYGNYTDTLRNNYHGETITYLRKTGREYIQLADTHFAACIAGTAGQVKNFFKSTENGLFSRWSFGTLPTSYEWQNKFIVADKSEPVRALALVAEHVRQMQEYDGEITFTKEQQREHGMFYCKTQEILSDTLGGAATSFLRRAALTHIRIAAVIETIIGRHNGTCSALAWRLASALLAHSVECGAQIIAELPESEAPARRKTQRAAEILAQLPDVFTSADIPDGISRATYFRYIQEWVAAGSIKRNGKEWNKTNKHS